MSEGSNWENFLCIKNLNQKMPDGHGGYIDYIFLTDRTYGGWRPKGEKYYAAVEDDKGDLMVFFENNFRSTFNNQQSRRNGIIDNLLKWV